MIELCPFFASGQRMIVATEFGLLVSYDGQSSTVSVQVPSNYSGQTCGLCGNFNGNPNDDFQTPSGQNVTSHLFLEHRGRLQAIIAVAMAVDPPAHNVLMIMRLERNLLCFAIQAYVSFCQSADVLIYPWRQNISCHMTCPAHSHYELCGNDCGRTCASSIDVTCDHVCSEGCFCDEGFVRSGTKCVPEEKCGCQHDDSYYYAGESFWTEGCFYNCKCTANNNISCIATSCSPLEECSLRDGHMGCYRVTDEPDPCRELKCTDNEWCGEKEGIHGCFCNENELKNSENFDAIISCVSSSGAVSLSRCLLFEAGFHPSALHLRDDTCKGSLQNGRLVFHFNNDDQLCGTVLKSNGTHFIYENVILGDDSLNTHMFFSCDFPLSSALSMNIKINPVESAIKKILLSGFNFARVSRRQLSEDHSEWKLYSGKILF
ncbi:hypothetical protein WMY93_010899 [Mugilogobius chulae]|uniref:VWFD domain-containing protein n=1 Tax=Mugilogobius chulae TaxID=88201 RepID=A0AAW0P9W1_9GOBI